VHSVGYFSSTVLSDSNFYFSWVCQHEVTYWDFLDLYIFLSISDGHGWAVSSLIFLPGLAILFTFAGTVKLKLSRFFVLLLKKSADTTIPF